MRGRVLWLPTSSAPNVFMRAAARTLPTPKPLDVAAREQGPVELFELADGVAEMARSHRGFAGTVEVLQRQVGRRAGWGRRGRVRTGDVGRESTRRLTHLWPRLTGSTSVPAADPPPGDRRGRGGSDPNPGTSMRIGRASSAAI